MPNFRMDVKNNRRTGEAFGVITFDSEKDADGFREFLGRMADRYLSESGRSQVARIAGSVERKLDGRYAPEGSEERSAALDIHDVADMLTVEFALMECLDEGMALAERAVSLHDEFFGECGSVIRDLLAIAEAFEAGSGWSADCGSLLDSCRKRAGLIGKGVSLCREALVQAGMLPGGAGDPGEDAESEDSAEAM